jgi:hypothetical protein
LVPLHFQPGKQILPGAYFNIFRSLIRHRNQRTPQQAETLQPLPATDNSQIRRSQAHKGTPLPCRKPPTQQRPHHTQQPKGCQGCHYYRSRHSHHLIISYAAGKAAVHIYVILLYFRANEKGFANSFPFFFHVCICIEICHLFQK